MDLSFSPEEESFRARVRKFLTENLPPGWGGAGGRPAGMTQLEFLRDWQHRLYDNGFLGMSWPKEYGGQGGNPIVVAIFNDEAGRVGAPAGGHVIGLAMAGPTIISHGTKEQKERYLANILSGEEIWCQGYSEPNSGSDVASLTTRAELK